MMIIMTESRNNYLHESKVKKMTKHRNNYLHESKVDSHIPDIPRRVKDAINVRRHFFFFRDLAPRERDTLFFRAVLRGSLRSGETRRGIYLRGQLTIGYVNKIPQTFRSSRLTDKTFATVVKIVGQLRVFRFSWWCLSSARHRTIIRRR